MQILIPTRGLRLNPCSNGIDLINMTFKGFQISEAVLSKN